jgi:hypothetical protein
VAEDADQQLARLDVAAQERVRLLGGDPHRALARRQPRALEREGALPRHREEERAFGAVDRIRPREAERDPSQQGLVDDQGQRRGRMERRRRYRRVREVGVVGEQLGLAAEPQRRPRPHRGREGKRGVERHPRIPRRVEATAGRQPRPLGLDHVDDCRARVEPPRGPVDDDGRDLVGGHRRDQPFDDLREECPRHPLEGRWVHARMVPHTSEYRPSG